MNERIKEFRFKAAEYANEQKPLGLMKWNEIRDAKFAELIIRECARKIGDLMDFTDYPDDAEKSMVELKTLRDARQVIKEHFGIE